MEAVRNFLLMLATALGAGILAALVVFIVGGITLAVLKKDRANERDEAWMVAWALLVGLAGAGTFGGVVGWTLAGMAT